MSIPKVERQVNLVIALLETRRPLTLEEIKSRTGYYDQRDERAARQMFERDKRELRAAGVPIATEPPGPFDAADGYIIHRAEYEQPDLDLNEEEATALAVARRVLEHDEHRLSMVRAVARSPDGATPDGDAATRVEVTTGPVEAFADALAQRRSVAFSYRTGDGRQGQRTVDPYAVATRNGNWYLIGRDHGRDAVRAFRLDRIVGAFEVLDPAGAFERPSEVEVDAHLSLPGERLGKVVVSLHPDIAHQAEARGATAAGNDPDGWTRWELADVDRHRTVTWLVGLAGRVRVHEPSELTRDVRDQLEAVLRVHA